MSRKRFARVKVSGFIQMPAGWFAAPASGGPPCPICRQPMYRGDCGYVCGAPGPQHGRIYSPDTIGRMEPIAAPTLEQLKAFTANTTRGRYES